MNLKRFEIPDEAKAYIEAMKNLVEVGIALSPLQNSCLINMPVVTSRVSSKSSSEERATQFICCVEELLRDPPEGAASPGENVLLSGNDAEVIRILFGLGRWTGMLPKKRREAAAKLRDIDWTWDNYRKDPQDRDFYRLYMALYKKGEGEQLATSRDEGSSAYNEGSRKERLAQALAEGGDFVTDSYECHYNFPSVMGEPREFLQIRKITAIREDLKVWRQSFSWTGYEADLPDVRLFGPGKYSVTHEGPYARADQFGRIYVREVTFPLPLQAGHSVDFSLVMTQSVRFDEIVRVGWQDSVGLTGTNGPIGVATVSVRFPPGIIPARVWHYESIPSWLIPGIADEQNSLVVDALGYVSYKWEQPRIGYSCGIAWIW